MIFLYCLGAVLLFLIWENLRHRGRLKRIPIRIHVNGIRGKTSTVREIAGALRAAGIRTVAKTTGDEPLVALPDGNTRTISRLGPPRIQEQLGVIRKAVSCNAQALVVECMALHPMLQLTSERKIIRSHIGVITNVRHDHQEVMGEGLKEIADCLRCTIPTKGHLIQTDQAFSTFFESEAQKRGSRVSHVRGSGSNPFLERAAVVEKVCSLVGIPFKPAPVITTWPRPLHLLHKGRRITFWDAFSVNDVDSFRYLLESLCGDRESPRPVVVLLNNRADRPLRMKAFAAFLAGHSSLDAIMLLGANRLLAKHYLKRQGRNQGVHAVSSQSPTGIFDEILEKIPSPSLTLIGAANHRGPAGDLVGYVRKVGSG